MCEIENVNKKRIDLFADYVNSIIENYSIKTVVEIGCGDGKYNDKHVLITNIKSTLFSYNVNSVFKKSSV